MRDLFRNSTDRLIESLKLINKNEFLDIGVVVETRIPNTIPDKIFEENVRGYGFIRCQHENNQHSFITPGILIYYNTNTVEINNVEIKEDIEQIFCSVTLKNHTDFTFNLAAFYMQSRKKDIFEYQQKQMPFIAIGDLNMTVEIDQDKITKKLRSSGTIEISFERMLVYNKVKQLNSVKNDTGGIIDVCFGANIDGLNVESNGNVERLFTFTKKEKFHEPVIYKIIK